MTTDPTPTLASLPATVTGVTPQMGASVRHMGPPIPAQVKKIENIKAGPIRLGTQGKHFMDRTDKLKPNNPTLLAANKAFEDLLALVKEVPEYKDLVTLMVDCDRSIATITLQSNKVEKVTIGDLKTKLVKAGKNLLVIEDQIVSCFRKFDLAFMRMGMKTYSHYSPEGPDSLASNLGGKALTIERDTHPLIQHQQAHDLDEAAKSKHGIVSLIGHSCSTEAEKKEAVDKALRAEAFFLRFRDTLTERIDELTDENLKEPDRAKKQIILAKLDPYIKLRDQLLEANRHALWASAIYSDPKECHRRILYDYYVELYPDLEAQQNTSFRKFCGMQEAVPFVQRAAEIASLLIIDPLQYRLFCDDCGIQPRDHHINRLLNHVLNNPAVPVPYELLGHTLTPDEEIEVNGLITDALTEADGLEGQVDLLSNGAKSARERFVTALTAKTLFPLLRDKKTHPLGFFSRLYSRISGSSS